MRCLITMSCLYHISRLRFQLRGSMREFFPRLAIIPEDLVFSNRPERENQTSRHSPRILAYAVKLPSGDVDQAIIITECAP